MNTLLWEFEDNLHAEGYSVVCGVDEAGRGPLAGPVCAAAVILPRGIDIDGLDDSKKLTAKRRDALYDIITSSAEGYGIAFATVEEIEELNILGATYLAMNRSIAAIGRAIDLAIIDGNRNKGIGYPSLTVIRGDSKCASIAAASILAKVTRDRYMVALAEQYPGYGFEKHKGYGTAEHYAAIREFGPCPEHRARFLRKMH